MTNADIYLAGQLGDELHPEPMGWEEDKTDKVLTCSDCPPDDCTGHCFSCPYGAQ